MIFALDNGNRIAATPGAKAICPSCGTNVLAKCGSIKTWHWAHERAECDAWQEGMTEWHLKWQSKFPVDLQEVVIRKDGVFHRADVLLPNGRVVEFQHSSIGVEEIQERERFYGSMIWVFDVRDAYKADRLLLRDRRTHYTFRWKHPRLSISRARCQVYLHYSEFALLELGGMWSDAPCGGWGRRVDISEFTTRLLSVRQAA